MIKQNSHLHNSSWQQGRSAWRRLTRLPATAGIALLLCHPAAQALNLGDIVLESGYGQPLSATLPISIRRGEILTADCIRQVAATEDAGFAQLKEVTIVVPSAGAPGIYTVSISSPYRLTEPMYELRLQINCTGSSNFIRSFTLIPEVAQSGSAITAQTESSNGNLPPTGTDSPTGSSNNTLVAPTSSQALNAAVPTAATVATAGAALQANLAQAPATTNTPEAGAEARNMAAAYVRAREVAEAAAKEARAAELATTSAETDAIPEPKRRSGSLLLAVIIGGLIGSVISLLIMGRRMLAAKRKLRQPFIDPETAARYANYDDFIAPVSAEHNFENTFVVEEDEELFRKTVASDEHASRLMARMEDANKLKRDPAGETADRLPRSAVNSSFLDSNPDLFDHASQHSEPNHEYDTLQDIFNEALFTDQEDPDAPVEKRVQAAKHATENVQRLAKTAEDQDDQNLSATLIDALHLLEQEYQEELTASQVLDPEDVRKSLGWNHKL